MLMVNGQKYLSESSISSALPDLLWFHIYSIALINSIRTAQQPWTAVQHRAGISFPAPKDQLSVKGVPGAS